MNRRLFVGLLATPAYLPAVSRAQRATSSRLVVCMHQATSGGRPFREAMEGYARAGIRAVEVELTSVREFAEKESPDAARRVLDDLGLSAVSSSNQLFLDESGPLRASGLEELRWKVELARAIGCDRLVCPSAASEAHVEGDYESAVENLIQAADIARPAGVSLMVEFTHASTLIGTLRTAIRVVRAADHPNLKLMLDTWHFWAGRSKFEDLELLREGELHHLHFEDVPASPSREVIQRTQRVFPGEGVAPLRRILEALRDKGYAGPVSLEHPAAREMEPYQAAMRARQTIEPLIAGL
jgi:2-keto-myo-inositol isomerase